MRRVNGKIRWMAIKFDLNKAYDMLSWCFIYETHSGLGLPENLVNVIMKIIGSTTFNLEWNRELTNSFALSKGILQGDSLSQYIFAFCDDRLTLLIEHAISLKE